VSRYRFIEVEKGNHAVRTLCRVLQVSRAAYYHWSIHPLSAHAAAELELSERIAAIHARSRQTYGAPNNCVRQTGARPETVSGPRSLKISSQTVVGRRHLSSDQSASTTCGLNSLRIPRPPPGVYDGFWDDGNV
jgi:hypothetical protein